MSKTLIISDETYRLLESQARKRELESVEQFLNELAQDELESRRETVCRIRDFRQKMLEKYGVLPDSTELIREDRMRG